MEWMEAWGIVIVGCIMYTWLVVSAFHLTNVVKCPTSCYPWKEIIIDGKGYKIRLQTVGYSYAECVICQPRFLYFDKFWRIPLPPKYPEAFEWRRVLQMEPVERDQILSKCENHFLALYERKIHGNE
jgi:hypothetical protein